jgi:lysophospholipase L1-like esterase
MKISLGSVFCLVSLLIVPLYAQPSLLKPHDVVAICGDSITYQKQYSVMMEDYFLMCQPVPDVRAVVFGSAGETSNGLSEHMKNDVLRFKPTVITTLYGMNDGKYLPYDQEHEQNYIRGQTSVIAQAKQAGIRVIVLGSPTCVDPAKYSTPTSTVDVYNDTLKRLGQKGQEIAKENGIIFADVNTIFADVMAKAKAANGAQFQLSGDGVHPLLNGHLATTYAFLKALGCDGAIGTIRVDMMRNDATGTPGQKIISMKDGVIQVESTRYPFCFWGNPTDPNTTISVVKFFPFNHDLNRYLLVVDNLTDAKAKVTWGTQSKEFTAAELAKGINLADEFLDNPFVAQFQAVDHAVSAQQYDDTDLIHFINSTNDIEKVIPGQEAVFNELISKGISNETSMEHAAAALVIPIQHTIKIEPHS